MGFELVGVDLFIVGGLFVDFDGLLFWGDGSDFGDLFERDNILMILVGVVGEDLGSQIGSYFGAVNGVGLLGFIELSEPFGLVWWLLGPDVVWGFGVCWG